MLKRQLQILVVLLLYFQLLGAVADLKAQLEAKHTEMEGLKMNVDLLEGGLQVLNREITTQGNEIVKVQTKAQNRIRYTHDFKAQLY